MALKLTQAEESFWRWQWLSEMAYEEPNTLSGLYSESSAREKETPLLEGRSLLKNLVRVLLIKSFSLKFFLNG